MRKSVISIFLLFFLFAMAGCGSQDIAPETPGAADSVVQNSDTDQTKEEKSWSEQDLGDMFEHIKKTDWEYIDCVLFPDQASDRIGAVLFWDNESGTSNVAFFDADGYSQQCGTYAKVADEPNFTYLGDGAVTFVLEPEQGIVYQHTLAISVEDGNVKFKAEDEVLEQP